MEWKLVAPPIWNLLTQPKAGIACNYVVVSFSNWIGDTFSRCFFLVRLLHPRYISVLLQSSNSLIISPYLESCSRCVRIKDGHSLPILDHFCNPARCTFQTFGGDWSASIFLLKREQFTKLDICFNMCSLVGTDILKI